MVKTPQTPQTPALFIAWVDSNQNINVSSSIDNGQTWQSLPAPGQTSPFPPALAYFDSKLYLAWTGIGNQPKLNVLSYGGGTQWTGQQTPGDQCNAGPALVASEDVLCMAHAGNDAAHSLNIWFSSDGSNWNPQINFNPEGETTAQSPALAAGPFQAPVLAWIAGTGVTKPINYIIGLECMVGVTQAHPADISSQFSPALTLFNNLVFLAYVDKKNTLKLKASADGAEWLDKTTPGTVTSPVTSSAGPALTASATTLYLAWAEQGGGQLKVNTYNTAGTWGTTSNSITGANSGQAPALAYGNAFPPSPTEEPA